MKEYYIFKGELGFAGYEYIVDDLNIVVHGQDSYYHIIRYKRINRSKWIVPKKGIYRGDGSKNLRPVDRLIYDRSILEKDLFLELL